MSRNGIFAIYPTSSIHSPLKLYNKFKFVYKFFTFTFIPFKTSMIKIIQLLALFNNILHYDHHHHHYYYLLCLYISLGGFASIPFYCFFSFFFCFLLSKNCNIISDLFWLYKIATHKILRI